MLPKLTDLCVNNGAQTRTVLAVRLLWAAVGTCVPGSHLDLGRAPYLWYLWR